MAETDGIPRLGKGLFDDLIMSQREMITKLVFKRIGQSGNVSEIVPIVEDVLKEAMNQLMGHHLKFFLMALEGVEKKLDRTQSTVQGYSQVLRSQKQRDMVLFRANILYESLLEMMNRHHRPTYEHILNAVQVYDGWIQYLLRIQKLSQDEILPRGAYGMDEDFRQFLFRNGYVISKENPLRKFDSEEEEEQFRIFGKYAVMFHDLGKIWIPVHILDHGKDYKVTGKVTSMRHDDPTAFDVMKTHQDFSSILADVMFADPEHRSIYFGVFGTHEQQDGMGYYEKKAQQIDVLAELCSTSESAAAIGLRDNEKHAYELTKVCHIMVNESDQHYILHPEDVDNRSRKCCKYRKDLVLNLAMFLQSSSYNSAGDDLIGLSLASLEALCRKRKWYGDELMIKAHPS